MGGPPVGRPMRLRASLASLAAPRRRPSAPAVRLRRAFAAFVLASLLWLCVCGLCALCASLPLTCRPFLTPSKAAALPQSMVSTASSRSLRPRSQPVGKPSAPSLLCKRRKHRRHIKKGQRHRQVFETRLAETSTAPSAPPAPPSSIAIDDVLRCFELLETRRSTPASSAGIASRPTTPPGDSQAAAHPATHATTTGASCVSTLKFGFPAASLSLSSASWRGPLGSPQMHSRRELRLWDVPPLRECGGAAAGVGAAPCVGLGSQCVS